MKKILLSAFVMLTSLVSMAQHEPGTITLQPKVGLNMATMTKINNSDPRFALAAGAELEYQVTDMVSIAGGLLYSMQGVKGKDEDTKTTVKMDYINIPIVANVYITKGLAVKLGLQPGFMVNDKMKVSDGSSSIETSLEQGLKASDSNAEIKKFDLSIPVGLSYEFCNVVVDARYNWGLTKIMNIADHKNSVFQLTLGYKFAL